MANESMKVVLNARKGSETTNALRLSLFLSLFISLQIRRLICARVQSNKVALEELEIDCFYS